MPIFKISEQLVIEDIDGHTWLIWTLGANDKQRTFTVILDLPTLADLHEALSMPRVKWVSSDRSLGVTSSKRSLVLFFQMRERPYAVLRLRLSEDESELFVLAVRERSEATPP